LEVADYVRERLNFAHCQIVLRVDREVRSPGVGVRSCETRYFGTSLDPGWVTPRGLQCYVRDHWQVENCLHYSKDRWWDEDRHCLRRPGLGEVFASLTNAALSVLRLLQRTGEPLRAVADAMQWSPLPALQRLGFLRRR
jgi:hypothetical protein